MKAWTYLYSCASHPYWIGVGDTPLICVELDSGSLEWRRVDTGAVMPSMGRPHSTHQAKLLDPVYYPQWYRDLDVYAVDVGL